MRFTWTIHRATHDRKMKWLFDVSQPPFDLRYDTDKVIDIEPATRRTRNDRNSTRPQTEGLHNLPRHSHFFLRFSGKRNANRVANTFVKQDPESDRRLYGSTERSACFGNAEMKRIVDLLRQ